MRIFIAIPTPQPLADALLDLCTDLQPAKWVPGDQFHTTLKFLGDVDPPDVDDLADGLADLRFGGIDLIPQRLDVFATGRNPRSLHLRLKPDPGLSNAHSAVERTAHAAGLPRDEKRFMPHITLARFDARTSRGLIESYIERTAIQHLAPQPAEELVLYESILGRNGATHRPLLTIDLPLPGDVWDEEDWDDADGAWTGDNRGGP